MLEGTSSSTVTSPQTVLFLTSTVLTLSPLIDGSERRLLVVEEVMESDSCCEILLLCCEAIVLNNSSLASSIGGMLGDEVLLGLGGD